MVKISIILVCAVVIFGCFEANPVKSENVDSGGKETGFNGRVKSMRHEVAFRLETGGFPPPDQYATINQLYFDVHGNIVQDYIYRPDGGFRFKMTYDYDLSGNVIESREYDWKNILATAITYSYDEIGGLMESCKMTSGDTITARFTYDSSGNMVNRTEYYPGDSLKSYKTLSYDLNGNVTRIEEYKANTLSRTTVMSYDSKDSLLEEGYYNSDGSLWGKYLYAWDARGNLIEYIFMGSDSLIQFREVNEYDAGNNRLQHIKYDGEGAVTVMEKDFYDPEGRLIGYEYYVSENSLLEKESYAYNENDDITYTYRLRADLSFETISNFSYEYDIHGNWIKKTTHIKDSAGEDGITRIDYRLFSFY